MPELPSGTITFVFSDIEGSTALLKRLGDDGYAAMLAEHRRLLREIFDAHGGSEIDTQGDAFFYSFRRARAAVTAAVELQRRHNLHDWPGGETVRVRLGLHTGEPIVGEEGYTGIDVVRAARIAADGRGGQILLSESTRALIGQELPDGVSVRGLGERTLKDLDQPEPLFELLYGEVPAATPQPKAPAKSGLDALDDYDPARMIEARVLTAIEKSIMRFGGKFAIEDDSPEARGNVADQIRELQKMHAAGALTDEQYAKAVDRVLNSS